MIRDSCSFAFRLASLSIWLFTMTCAGCALHGPLAREPGGSVESPHAVRGPGGGVIVAWGSVHEDGRADILLASGDGAPARVNRAPRSAVAGRQVGPRLAVTPGGRVLVSWVDRGRDSSGDILIAASDDGGRTFSAATRVNDDVGFAGQEYQDIAALQDGTVVLAWLDERGAPGGNENEKQVFFASSADGGRTFTANTPLTASPRGVCPCCRPGIAVSPDGALHVIYRDRSGDDLFVRMRTRHAGERGFGEPVTVSNEGWRFLACPVDGPSLIAAADGKLRAAWMDGTHGRETLWTAVSEDGGRSFRPAIPLCAHSSGSAGHAQLAHASLGEIATWDDDAGRVWLRIVEEPRACAVLVAGDDERSARSPQVVVDGDSVLVFWTEINSSESGDPPSAVPPSRLRSARLMARNGALILAP